MYDKSKKKIIFIYYILTFSASLSSSPILIKWFHYLNLFSQSNEIFTVLDENDYCYTPCNCIQKNNCITLDAAYFVHPRIKTFYPKDDVSSYRWILLSLIPALVLSGDEAPRQEKDVIEIVDRLHDLLIEYGE